MGTTTNNIIIENNNNIILPDNLHNNNNVQQIFNNNYSTLNREKEQIFSFWANLMPNGSANSDVCRYPSQSSILNMNGDPAWQPLEHTANLHPPVVELLD